MIYIFSPNWKCLIEKPAGKHSLLIFQVAIIVVMISCLLFTMTGHGFVEGRAELLEAYYFNRGQHDNLQEFGLGHLDNILPEFPLDLEFYKNKTFQVFLTFL